MDKSELISGESTDLNKQDILQLLNTGIKENQTFAKWFADTVLVDVQRKLKDLKIQSTAIKIDGKGISENINQQIRDSLEKDVDNIIKQAKADIKKDAKVSKKIDTPSAKINSKPIIKDKPEKAIITPKATIQNKTDVKPPISAIKPSKIIAKENKITPKQTIPTAKIAPKTTIKDKPEKAKITPKIDAKDKIEKAQITPKATIQDNSIASIVGATPKMSLMNQWRYQGVVKKLLSKIENGIPDKFNFKDVSMGEIFRPPGNKASDTITYLRSFNKWNAMQSELLGTVTESIPKKFAFNKISLSDIFTPPNVPGLTAMGDVKRYFAWAGIQNKLLENLKGAVSNTKFKFNKEITFDQIFGSNEKSSLLSALKWNKLQNVLIDKIKNQAISPIDTLNKIEPLKASRKKKTKDESEEPAKPPLKAKMKEAAGFKSLEEKGQEIMVGGFTDRAIKDLKKLFDRGGKEEGKDKKEPTSVKDMMSKLKSMGSMFSKMGPMLKNFGAGAAKQIGLKPLSAGGGAVATGVASAGTNLLLAKYTVDLGRMVTSKKVRDEKEGSVGKALDDPKKGFFGKALSGVANLPAVITGYFSEKEKQQKLKKEGGADAAQNKKTMEAMVKKTIGNEKFDEIRSKAFKDPKLKKAQESGDMTKYNDMYQKYIATEARKMQNKKEPSTKTETPPIAAKPIETPPVKKEVNDPMKSKAYLDAKARLDTLHSDEAARKKQQAQDRWNKENGISVTNTFSGVKPVQLPLKKIDSKSDIADIKSAIVSKDNKMIDKLVTVMKDNKPDEKVAQKAEQQMNQMRMDINKLIVKMGGVMDALISSSKESKKQSGPVTTMGGLAGISEDAGDMRDPAYILRSRAWDRIRKGYVVI
jgi:hypothetical protein